MTTSRPDDLPPIPDDHAATIRDDPWASTLGLRYQEIRRGYCRVSLDLQPHMVNFQGYPHGGVIFSLADIAFGAACNSHGEPAVALSATIAYVAAVEPRATLVAEAREVRQGRQAGCYEVEVRAADGRLVAAGP
ncbi:MAG: PaaI family thioesterase [Candidatus Rokuibacteriota bacterium]